MTPNEAQQAHEMLDRLTKTFKRLAHQEKVIEELERDIPMRDRLRQWLVAGRHLDDPDILNQENRFPC